MVINLTKTDISEMAYAVVRSVLNEEAGVAKDWYNVFLYAANEMWRELITGSYRLKDKMRNGKVVKPGERRGPKECVVKIPQSKLYELSERGRLAQQFPQGLTFKNFFWQGIGLGQNKASINLETGLVKVGMFESFLPVTGENEEQRKARFIDNMVGPCMHEITHGLNGEGYAENYANSYFRRNGSRKDRPYGEYYLGASKNVHDIAYSILYLFLPGEMNARVSGFYYGLTVSLKHFSSEEIMSKEMIQNDIKELTVLQEPGKYFYQRCPVENMSPSDRPQIPDMEYAIKMLSQEEYSAYVESEEKGVLHSIVACLLTYPDSIINVRKYGKIYSKGGEKKLRNDAIPCTHDCSVIVKVNPNDGYRLKNSYTVVDKDGERVGQPLDDDIYEKDENGKFIMAQVPGYSFKDKVEKNLDDVVVTGFRTSVTLSHEEFEKCQAGEGNMKILYDHPKYGDDQYSVPDNDLRKFSSKIKDEASFEAVKMDMVKQLTDTLQNFKRRIFKAYYMALKDTVDSRKQQEQEKNIEEN